MEESESLVVHHTIAVEPWQGQIFCAVVRDAQILHLSLVESLASSFM